MPSTTPAAGGVDSEMNALGKECADLADAITDLIVALDPVLRPAGPSTGSSVPTCEPMCELAGRIASARQGITERVALLREIRQRLAL